MSVAIAGMGWITPLGATLDDVWSGMMAGKAGHAVELKADGQERTFSCLGVDESLLRTLGRTPRLRRSSAVSYHTAAAGLAALADAGYQPEEMAGRRLALVFGVASGGVVYTRRFYDKIARENAGAASPLLFPETVYNAPASHLSSMLGTDGATYSLVGDATVGIEALALGSQLLEADAADLCLVVTGEELDWILCEAYRQWRLVNTSGSAEVYARHPRGMQMSEGAAAVLLAREGQFVISALAEGIPFFRRSELAEAFDTVVKTLPAAHVAIGSANGTFIDSAERAVLAPRPERSLFAPKSLLGESLGSGALCQVICGALALARQELPATALAPDWPVVNRESRELRNASTALISVAGLNHQVSALTLRPAS